MRKFGLFFLVLFLVFVGCKHPEAPLDKSAIAALQAKAGVIIERRDFPVKSLTLSKLQPDKQDGAIKSEWTPATISIQPLELREMTGSKTYLKGVVITVTETYWTISGFGEPKHGNHDIQSSTLDLDDAKSLDAAITTMKQTAQQWMQKAPQEDTSQWFRVKGGFSTWMGRENGKPKYVIESYGVPTASAQLLPSELDSFQSELKSSIDLMDKN
jgi:hypothetical protein